MNTVLAIISHPKDNHLVVRHWPYFKLCGWDILGCGTDDGKCEWPEPVMRLDTGKMGTRMTPAGSSIFGLVEQELEIIGWFLDHQSYDALCIVEPDNLFVRKPVEHPQNGMYLAPLLPNYCRPGIFKTPIYMSTPRMMDRKCAHVFYGHAQSMFRAGDVEWWISDRFPAHVCHAANIPWINYPAWSPLPFVWGASDPHEAWVRDARCAIALGACCLHSVKTEKQLEAVRDLLPPIHG